jgi:hypothetical protein
MVRRYRTFGADSGRWDRFEFRPGDIVISSPPRSGTTWTQVLCALLVFGGPEFPAPLERISPWLDQQTRPVGDVLADLAAQRHRRFVKTHPRDVAVSLCHHFANLDFDRLRTVRADAVGLDDLADLPPRVRPPTDPAAHFRVFVEVDSLGGPATLATVLHHLSTGWERRADANVALFHYADYQVDLPGELVRLGRVLGIDVDDAGASSLARHAALDQMRERVGDVVPNASDGIWLNPDAFLRQGSSGQWRDLVSAEDLALYDQRVASLVPPDLAAWAHGGRLGRGVNVGAN